jgi:hypothetical protein
MSITNAMRECVSQVRRGGFCAYGFETLARCTAAGLLDYLGDADPSEATAYGLTTAGAAEADAYERQRVAGRARGRQAAKARADALRSVGMRRSRGGWE